MGRIFAPRKQVFVKKSNKTEQKYYSSFKYKMTHEWDKDSQVIRFPSETNLTKTM